MKCRICGNEKENQTYEAREMMIGYRDIFHYFQCSKCDCLQICDFPVNMSKYYPDDYYSYRPIIYRKKRSKFLIGLRDKYALWGYGFIGKLLYTFRPNEKVRSLSFIPVDKDTSILDVGCGVGTLLYSLREIGLVNLLGVDPFNEKDIEYRNGLVIQKREIHDVQGKWDIVMFHHSFEHIPDPLTTLKTVSGLLTPNGHCIISIPLSSSYAWRHYRVNWANLDAPRHLFLHSVKSMNILANQTGFDLQKLVYDSDSRQFWGSEQYIRDIPLRDERSYSKNPKSSIFSKREIAAFAKRAKELNITEQGDSAVFYLRK